MVQNIFEQFGERFPSVLDSLQDSVTDTTSERQILHDRCGKFGVASIDIMTGGLPRGVTELYGEPGAGKTTLMGAVLAHVQQAGKMTGMVPSEYLDCPYLSKMGVELEALPLFRMVGDEVIDMTAQFVQQDDTVLFIDSLTALRPDLEEPAGWERWVCQYLDTLTSQMGQGSGVVVTNQLRSTKSRLEGRFFSGSDSAARGLVDRFSLRLELSRSHVSEDQYWMDVNVVANLMRKPGQTCQVLVRKGTGIDIKRDFVDTAVALGIMEVRGSTYWFAGLRLGVGREQVADSIFSDPNLHRRILERF